MVITANVAVRPTHVYNADAWWELRNRTSERFGIPLAALLCIVSTMIMRAADDKWTMLPLCLSLCSALPLYLLLRWGNYFARFPHQVIVEEGRGLWLIAGSTRLFVDVQNLHEVRHGFRKVVRLKKRQRLLGQFVIPILFGRDATRLMEAIEREIRNRNS